jgi:mannosyl-oligosaccharide alpha-1,2-mannosidase
MFLKTMDSVREYLLYRPMVPDNRDILFSGKVSTAGGPHTDLQFESEVTHLTCFLGGMVGMGAKIFSQDADLEIAKKLTDGCVWAYESMGSGIMPEAAKVLACNSVTDCSWSETIWHKSLDPLADQRDELIKEYDMSKAIYDAQEAAESLEEESELIIEASEAHRIGGSTSKFDSYDADADMKTPVSAGSEGNIGRSIPSSSLMKRKEAHSPLAHDLSDKVLSSRSETQLSALDTKHIFQRKLKDMEDELLLTSPGREIEIPPEKVPQAPAPTKTIDMNRPLTHEQYVEKKIRREGLAPGFVQISFDKYMLR